MSEAKNLKCEVKWVLRAIAMRRHTKFFCRKTVAELCLITGFNEREVKTAIKILKDKKLLIIEGAHKNPEKSYRTVHFWKNFPIEGKTETVNGEIDIATGKRVYMTYEHQLWLYNQNLIIGVLAQFARMERESIVQRVRSGLQRAKTQGKTLGRPKGTTDDRDILTKYKPVVQDIENNISIRKIAKIHNISQNTILKVKRAMVNAA